MSLKKIEKPFFSIVIPTRDRAFLLEGLINSIINQDFQDFEIIVADNSTDNLSQNFLADLKENNCIRNIRTGGLNMADNWDLAINAISGKFLLLFSDKMILKQGSLKFLKEFINTNHPDCVTWNIDVFIDRNSTYFDKSNKLNNRTISSEDLLKFILKSDMISFDSSAFHCNSAISYEVIKKSLNGKFSIFLSLLSAAYWIIESVVVYFVLLAFDVDILEFTTIIATYTSSIILGVASFLPMGIGVTEGSLTGFFALKGVDISLALTIVIFIRIFTRWIGVGLGFISLKIIGGFSVESKKEN